jgi:enolase
VWRATLTLYEPELGANVMPAVSIAACKVGAAEKEVLFQWMQVPLYKHIADLVGKSATLLPVPAITVINGGKYAGNVLPVQVFPQNLLDLLLQPNFLFKLQNIP